MKYSTSLNIGIISSLEHFATLFHSRGFSTSTGNGIVQQPLNLWISLGGFIPFSCALFYTHSLPLPNTFSYYLSLHLSASWMCCLWSHMDFLFSFLNFGSFFPHHLHFHVSSLPPHISVDRCYFLLLKLLPLFSKVSPFVRDQLASQAVKKELLLQYFQLKVITTMNHTVLERLVTSCCWRRLVKEKDVHGTTARLCTP